MTDDTGRTCTFCSCQEAAEYLLVGRDQPIPLCAHHAALVGSGEDEAVQPIAGVEPRPVALDPHRLLQAAVTGES